MQKDTVLLDVHTYNELRDFKEKFTSGQVYRLSSGVYISSPKFVDCDEALKEMGDIIKQKEQKIDKIEDELYELKYSNNGEPSINKLKNMSWWSLIKWRISKR